MIDKFLSSSCKTVHSFLSKTNRSRNVNCEKQASVCSSLRHSITPGFQKLALDERHISSAWRQQRTLWSQLSQNCGIIVAIIGRNGANTDRSFARYTMLANKSGIELFTTVLTPCN